VDWSKAKTYLILTFFLLDLLLGYQYYEAQQQEAGYVQSYATQLQELRELLAERGIALQAEVPKETPEMRFLQAGYPQQPVKQIVAGTMPAPQLVEDDKSRGTMLFRTGVGEFKSTEDGYYRVRFEPTIQLDASNQQRPAHALQKLAHNVWRSDLYREDSYVGNQDSAFLHYYQMYQKYPVFSASLDVQLQNSEIIGYNQKALEIGQEDQTGRRVLSAISALRQVVETLDPKTLQAGGMAIRDIRLGYYSPNFADADVWYLAPIWRVVTDEKTFYVNAFTGQVEKGAPNNNTTS
jgi:regulatory protein YycI of two-component signal transduction system YycFG